jgi:23S rRNA pseudouridine2604 synthase
VARQLIGEDSGVEKEYLVRVGFGAVSNDVQAVFPPQQLKLLRHGLSLDGQALKPAQVDWQNPSSCASCSPKARSARSGACARSWA